jgi:hypothetical protein
LSGIKRVLVGVVATGAIATGTVALGAGSASADTSNWLINSYYYGGQWGSPVQWQVDQAWQLCQMDVSARDMQEISREEAGGQGQYGFWCADGGTNSDGSGKVNEWESYTS